MNDPDIPILIAAARARAAALLRTPGAGFTIRNDAELLLALAERLERLAAAT